MPHILLVEDDVEISRLVSRYLRAADFRVSVLPDGRKMERLLEDSRVDLILLDLMLPGEDGLSLCRRLRTHSGVPIIMVTAKGDELDRIVGLEMGADDYLSKPFNPRELLARINAVLRRQSSAQTASATSGATNSSVWLQSVIFCSVSIGRGNDRYIENRSRKPSPMVNAAQTGQARCKLRAIPQRLRGDR